jgi:hypothetical protein
MCEGLFDKTRLKIAMADRIPANLIWRRRCTVVLGYGPLSRIAIRSAINAEIIVS